MCCCHLACFILEGKFPVTINAKTYTVISQSNKRNLLWLQAHGLVSRGLLLQENYMALLFVLALVRITMVVTLWTFEKYNHCSFFYEVTHEKKSFSVFDIIINIFTFEKCIRVISFSQTWKKGLEENWYIYSMAESFSCSPGAFISVLWPHGPHCSLPDSSVHEISLGRILEWVDISFAMGSSWLKDRTFITCIAGGLFTAQPSGKPQPTIPKYKIESKKSSATLGVEMLS